MTWGQGICFCTYPAKLSFPFLKKRWNDSEGMSQVPLHRGGLLAMAPDIFFSLVSRTGVSWLRLVAISKDVLRDR